VVFEDVEVENEGLNTVEETDEIQENKDELSNNELVTNTDQIDLNVEINEQNEEKDLDKNLSEKLIIKTEDESENEKSDVEFPETTFEMKLISKMYNL
jgi:hypothetical protein